MVSLFLVVCGESRFRTKKNGGGCLKNEGELCDEAAI